jgi:hypothetical protein
MRALLNDLLFGGIILGYLMATLIYLVVTHERKRSDDN